MANIKLNQDIKCTNGTQSQLLICKNICFKQYNTLPMSKTPNHSSSK